MNERTRIAAALLDNLAHSLPVGAITDDGIDWEVIGEGETLSSGERVVLSVAAAIGSGPWGLAHYASVADLLARIDRDYLARCLDALQQAAGAR